MGRVFFFWVAQVNVLIRSFFLPTRLSIADLRMLQMDVAPRFGIEIGWTCMHDPEALRSLHHQRFHAEPEIFAAPGRVNLIGEHTDYAEGFVMPAAIDFATLAAISPRSDGKIVIYSENYGKEREFEAAALPPAASRHWSDYPIGVTSILARRRPDHSRLQPHALGRCAPRLRPFQFRRRGGLHRPGHHFPDRGDLFGARAGPPVPARREPVRRRQLRHHGPVHLRQRRPRPRPAARLPRSQFQAGAHPAHGVAGHRQHHGEARRLRRRIHQPPRRGGRGRRGHRPPPS